MVLDSGPTDAVSAPKARGRTGVLLLLARGKERSRC